jgi:hypothetical protein
VGRIKKSKTINTDGGAYVNGDIAAQRGVVLRDQINNITNNFNGGSPSIPTDSEKLERLERLKAWSKAGCEERWIALGIPDEKIPLFLENPIFDRTDRVISFDEAQPLKILIGDFGVGKSLIVEMLFQKLVENAIRNPQSPIPIFIPSDELTDNLFEDIEERASELIGDWRKVGVRVIVDGADEISQAQTGKLLKQAITITKAEPKISIIIASRPLPDFENDYFKKVIVPELSNHEIRVIVEILSGHPEHEHFLYGQPDAVLDALKKPFFAILYGLYRQQSNNMVFKSKGELISHLVETAVKNSKIEDIEVSNLLEKLAILVVERQGKYIPTSDVGTTEQIKSLLKSRLVIKRGKTIGFALPIFAQWFAAKGIENCKILVDQLISSVSELEKWYYPLIIFVSNASFDAVSQVLIPIAEKHPSILAKIIEASITTNYGQLEIDNIGLPTAREMGERIVLSMQAISNGLGLIASDLAPICSNGKVASIGIYKYEKRLYVLWYGNVQSEGIVELPADFGARFNKGEYLWRQSRSISLGLQGAWIWKVSLDAVRERMQEMFKKKIYFLLDGCIFKEQMWEMANKVMGYYYELSDSPIPIAEIRKCLESRAVSRNTQYLLNYLNRLEESGKENIDSLWPDSDTGLPGGYIWGAYSPERLAERASLIYSAAIEEYVNLVNRFFPSFSERLTTYATLPAKFVIYMVPKYGNDWELISYFDPLPVGEKSFVEIKIINADQRPLNIIDELYKKLREMRPSVTQYQVRHSGFDPDFFGGSPVTNLVYDWLSDDLKDISWIN